MEKPSQFLIRVYGLIVNDHNEVLVTDEFQLNRRMTKFPGGGLQYGEGTVECLVREMHEECNGQEITGISHYYTTGYFQPAMFYPKHQLIGIYYTARLVYPIRFQVTNKPFDYGEETNGKQSFRWVKINQLNPEEFSFPIDKLVAEKFRQNQKPFP